MAASARDVPGAAGDPADGGVRPGAHEKAGGVGWRYVRSWPVAGPAAGGPDERDLRAGRDMRDGAVRAGL